MKQENPSAEKSSYRGSIILCLLFAGLLTILGWGYHQYRLAEDRPALVPIVQELKPASHETGGAAGPNAAGGAGGADIKAGY